MDRLSPQGDNPLASQISTNSPHERLKRRDAAAAYITDTFGMPCSPKTLAKLASIGGGPVFRKAGRIPLYSTADLNVWAEAKLSRPMLRAREGKALPAEAPHVA